MEVVNGYPCKNCTDVDNAKRNIDPQHPKDGPFGVNKLDKPGATPAHGPAVTLGGVLAQVSAASGGDQPRGATDSPKLDIRA